MCTSGTWTAWRTPGWSGILAAVALEEGEGVRGELESLTFGLPREERERIFRENARAFYRFM